MKRRVWLARAPFVLALALLAVLLARTSSLLRLVPVDVPAMAFLGVGFVAATILLLPALFAAGSPLPGALAVVVPLAAFASYGTSRLDWLRVLKDFGVAEESTVAPVRFALALGALLVAWLMHAVDLSLRLRWRAQERGVFAAQARAATRVTLRRTSLTAAVALGGTLVLLGVALASGLLARVLPVSRASFVAPVLAAVLLVAVAVVAAADARGEKDAGGSAER